tara:strand:+ start:595 stop:1275 length:681 start_codon:yes stop_codon:yes gene_type:complete
MNVVLLLRSYERGNYLLKTISSIIKSDIDLCDKRYVYDDNSKDKIVKEILGKIFLKIPNKEFDVVIGNENLGCKYSFVEALKHIKNENKNNEDYIVITIDNDVITQKDWISKTLHMYLKIKKMFYSDNFLLTGFNPTNSHLNMIKDYGDFYQKETCGGINLIFHNNMIDLIMEGWQKGDNDWGVINKLKEKGYPLFCFKESIINHIGELGLFSGNWGYDVDKNFKP